MKNFFCLFEGPFGMRRTGVFLFEMTFFISEILTFFCCVDWFSDDVVWCATEKWWNAQWTISLKLSKRCSWNLAPRMCITEETK